MGPASSPARSRLGCLCVMSIDPHVRGGACRGLCLFVLLFSLRPRSWEGAFFLRTPVGVSEWRLDALLPKAFLQRATLSGKGLKTQRSFFLSQEEAKRQKQKKKRKTVRLSTAGTEGERIGRSEDKAEATKRV